MIILDTDYLSIVMWPRSPLALRIEEELKTRIEEACTTIINYEEQMRGWLAYVAKAKSIAEEIKRYEKLKRHIELFRNLPVVAFDEAAAVRYQTLKKSKIRIGAMDLKIGAIALANNAELATRNRVDFSLIPGLKLLDLLRNES